MMRTLRAAAAIAAAGMLVLALAACGPPKGDSAASAPDETSSAHMGHDNVEEPAAAPLRDGESWQKLTMTEPYTPAPPTGVGTDDYRCFLLDPKLAQDSYLTGTQVLPGNPNVVHHVILFRVPPSDVSIAQEVDAGEDGPGWTCFGDTRVGGQQVDDAPWLGAWAPGSGEAVYGKGLGVPLAKGSQIIMQVHYNLLAGQEPDTSSTQLRLTSGDADLTPVTTVLIPAPVELPCRPGHTDNPLCDRAKALEDVKARFGEGPGATADYLHFLCGTPTVAGPTQTCTRTIRQKETIHGVAGHMHLLGQSIKIEVNPGTPRARIVLDIPMWDFDNQTAKPVKPAHLRKGDTVKVTCEHSQDLRDNLPAFEGQPDRYVVWGEGSTDEMCLGILQVSRP